MYSVMTLSAIDLQIGVFESLPNARRVLRTCNQNAPMISYTMCIGLVCGVAFHTQTAVGVPMISYTICIGLVCGVAFHTQTAVGVVIFVFVKGVVIYIFVIIARNNNVCMMMASRTHTVLFSGHSKNFSRE